TSDVFAFPDIDANVEWLFFEQWHSDEAGVRRTRGHCATLPGYLRTGSSVLLIPHYFPSVQHVLPRSRARASPALHFISRPLDRGGVVLLGVRRNEGSRRNYARNGRRRERTRGGAHPNDKPGVPERVPQTYQGYAAPPPLRLERSVPIVSEGVCGFLCE